MTIIATITESSLPQLIANLTAAETAISMRTADLPNAVFGVRIDLDTLGVTICGSWEQPINAIRSVAA